MIRETLPRETSQPSQPPENSRLALQPDSTHDAQPENGKRALTKRGRSAVARILKCATEMFITEGYGGLTMRKVASAAGISLSNLQHYFSSIEALFAALMKQVIEEYAMAYDSVRHDPSLTPDERLEKVIRLLIEDDKQSRTQSLFINMWALAQTHDFARN